MDFEYLLQEVELCLGESIEVGYWVWLLNCGYFVFFCCELELFSLLCLWWQCCYLEVCGEICVYLDFVCFYGVELMVVDYWFNQIGVCGGQCCGFGLEFYQLCEFCDGDILCQIDWKVIVCKCMLIVCEYQDECDQQIFFLFDCGCCMCSQDGDLLYFDYVFNVSLLLVYVVLCQGDVVGVMIFVGDDCWYFLLGKGSVQFGVLFNIVYDLQISQCFVDFLEVVQVVLFCQWWWVLVILVINLCDEDDEELFGVVKCLGCQYWVLVVSLCEEVFDILCYELVVCYEQVFVYIGIIDYLNVCNGFYEKFVVYGVLVFDVCFSEFGLELISCYLGWKCVGVF